MKLFIAIPCYQGMPVQFVHCVFQTHWPKDSKLHMVSGNSWLGLARGIAAADFLSTDCTHILYIDSDIIFSQEHIDRITSHDEAIVGGFYAKKEAKRDWVWVCNSLPDDKEAEFMDGRLKKVAYMGGGFLLVRRDVFDEMITVYGKEIGFKEDETGRQMWDFFTVGVHRPSNRWLSEDWWFCQRARDMGFTVYGDTNCILKHLGTAEYPIE
jgi:hypothetical protein